MKQLLASFWLPSILIVTLGFFWLFHNRGLTVHDEGYILDASWRFVNGEVPYRDFFIQYTPGIVFTIGGLFKLTGPSILAGRLLMVIIGGLISLLLYRITRSIIPSLLFLAWGIPQLNFPWPTWFALLFMLLSLATNKQSFLSGLFASITFLFKQNFGLATILAHLLIRPNLFGLVLPFLAIILYFLDHQALPDALQTIFGFNWRYAQEGIMATSFPLPNFTSISAIGKTFFYYFPLILLCFYAFKLVRRQLTRPQTIAFTYLGLFFLAGLRPTTDILHVSLIYPALFPLVGLLKPKYAWILFIPVFSLGLAKLYVKPYAGFEAPYLEQDRPITVLGRETLSVDDRASVLPQVVDVVKDYTTPQEPIFVYPYAPMLYCLTGHPNATSFPIATLDYLTLFQQHQLINQLAPVNLIILQHSLRPSPPDAIYDYLADNFQIATQIGDYQLLLRQ